MKYKNQYPEDLMIGVLDTDTRIVWECHTCNYLFRTGYCLPMGVTEGGEFIPCPKCGCSAILQREESA